MINFSNKHTLSLNYDFMWACIFACSILAPGQRWSSARRKKKHSINSVDSVSLVCTVCVFAQDGCRPLENHQIYARLFLPQFSGQRGEMMPEKDSLIMQREAGASPL